MQMKYFHSKSFRSKTIRPRFFFTKIYQAMFLSCVLILSPVVLFSVQTIEACAQENDKDGTTSELYALSAVLMDADNGRILLQKNGTEVLPMASTTKIMTCILALEQANPDDYVSVSSYAAGMPKVHLGVRKGDVFRLGDLLYSLMLDPTMILRQSLRSMWETASPEEASGARIIQKRKARRLFCGSRAL